MQSVSLKTFVFAFLLFNLTFALDYPSFNGYQILDLTSKNIDSFHLETQKWTISGLAGTANSSLCGTNNPLLGGYGILSHHVDISKTYSSLPTHDAIYYQITFNFIDKFKNPDYFTLTLDSTSIAGGSSLKTYNSHVTSNVCGDSDADTTQFTIAGSMPHTANTLAFKLIAKVAGGSGSGTLGIRDIFLTFVNDSSVTTASSCFRVFHSQLLGISGECSCVKGSYLSSGSCTTCDPACENCFGPDPRQCFACASGHSWDGTQCIQCDNSCLTCSGGGELQCVTCQDGYWLQSNGSCTATCDLPVTASQTVGSLQLCSTACTASQYLLWDETCVNNCSSPLVVGASGTSKLCHKPCGTGEYLYGNGSCIVGCSAPLLSSSVNGVATCNKPCLTGEYLDWNNNCMTGCGTPLLSSTTSDYVLICKKPCQNNEFLDWNNICIVTCLSPLVSSVINGVDICKKPCQNNDYLYSDGSCLSTCPSPFLQSSSLSVNLCQTPCLNSQFLYPDASCSYNCPVPLIPSIGTDGIQRCSSPCPNSIDFYYNANKTCGTSCSSPSKIQTIEFLKVCLTPLALSTDQGGLTKSEIESVEKAEDITNAAGAAVSVGIAASSVISSHGSGAITLISLIKMLDYIRYMKINFPPKLEYMMDSQNKDPVSLNFPVDLPESIERKFPNYPLSGKFEKYHMVSNFIVNYWEALFTLGILLFVLAAAIVIASCAQDVKYIGTYSKKIRDILKWNLFLIIFCSDIDSVGVFSSLEFRTTHFNSAASVFGTLVCVFINLLVLYLMLVIPYIIYSLRRARRKILPLGKILELNDYNAKTDSQRFALCGVLFMSFKNKSVLQHSCMFFILFRVYLFNIIIGYLFEYPLTQAILITTMSALMLGYLIITRPFKNPLELIKTLNYEIVIAIVNICVLILAVMDQRGLEYKESRAQLEDIIIFSNMFFNLMAVLFMLAELVIKIIKVYKIRKTIVAKGWKYWLAIITFLLKPEELEMDEKEQSIQRIKAKYKSKIIERLPSIPKKTALFKGQTLSDEQSSNVSDTPPPEKLPSISKKIYSPASRFNLNQVGSSKTNSIVSLDASSDFGSKNNLLTPANARTSILFSQNQLSPRSLLQSQDNQSVTPSSRILMRLSARLSFYDLEQQNKYRNEPLSVGMPGKLNEMKGIIAQRNKSTEVYQSKDRRRRNTGCASPSFLMFDNSESVSDSSFEVGSVIKTRVNTARRQSRFSRYLPEKLKILHEDNNNI